MNKDIAVAVALTVVYLIGIGSCRTAAFIVGVAMLYDWCQLNGIVSSGCKGCLDTFNADAFNERLLRSLRRHEPGHDALGAPASTVSTDSNVSSASFAPNEPVAPVASGDTKFIPPYDDASDHAKAKNSFYESMYTGDALTSRQNPGLFTLSALK